MKIKICYKCKIEKPITEFNKRKDSKDGYRNQCKECIKLPKEIFEPGFKRCIGGEIHCNEIKPLSEFSISTTSIDGYNNQCRKCRKILNKKWNENNLEHVKKYKKQYRKRKKIESGIPENYRICVCCKEIKHYNDFEETKIKCKECYIKDSLIIEKQCKICNEIKPLSEFNKSKGGKFGVGSACKICHGKKSKKWKENNKVHVKEYNEQWRKENPNYDKIWNELNPDHKKNYREKHREEIKENKKQYYQDNKEEILEYQKQYRIDNPEHNKQYYKTNKKILNEKARIRQNERYENDPLYVLKCSMRMMLQNTHKLIGTKKQGRTVDEIGYSPGKLKLRMEVNYTDGMWDDNYGKLKDGSWGWEIDHVIPPENFIKRGITDPKIINALSNLRPRWKTSRTINGVFYLGNIEKGNKLIF